MDRVEIKCIVRGILATASLETDQAKRDLLCLRAILKEPVESLVCTSTDGIEIVIDDLLETCYEGNIARMLTAEKHVLFQTHPSSLYGGKIRAQLYEVSLKKLQQVTKPTIVDLNTACTIYLNINEDKRGSARSLLRRFVKELGTSAPMDKFMDDLEDTIEVYDAMLDVREIISSALIEANGAYEIWLHLRPAFQEDYKSLDAWYEAEAIEAKLEVLITLEPTPQIIDVVRGLIIQLDLEYKETCWGDVRWISEKPERLKWWEENVRTK